MTTKKKTETEKKLTKDGRRAIAWLKKKALHDVRTRRYRTFYSTAAILKGLGIDHNWDARTKVYQDMIKALKHGQSLGLISGRGWGSPKSFQYIGPEVESAEKKRKEEQEVKTKEVTRAMNKLRLKGSARVQYDGSVEVYVSGSSVIRCAERLCPGK